MIFCIMGKSSCGKDTIYKEILKKEGLDLKRLVSYTTRPIREGEKNGQEYFFVDEKEYQYLKSENKLIEERAYHTVHGLWRYFTVNDEQFENDDIHYLIIGTLESYQSTRDYFGTEKVVPILIDLEDGERLTRALNREKLQSNPKYQEMCRRFLADSEDFSEENIIEAGITKRFYNDELSRCITEICDYIRIFVK